MRIVNLKERELVLVGDMLDILDKSPEIWKVFYAAGQNTLGMDHLTFYFKNVSKKKISNRSLVLADMDKGQLSLDFSRGVKSVSLIQDSVYADRSVFEVIFSDGGSAHIYYRK